jgi:hypothetical protein
MIQQQIVIFMRVLVIGRAAACVAREAGYRLGSDRGSPNQSSTLASKRVMPQIWRVAPGPGRDGLPGIPRISRDIPQIACVSWRLAACLRHGAGAPERPELRF